MSKRSKEVANVEGPNSEFKYDDSEDQLRKKIKLENEKIIENIKEINEDIDISKHEVYKFLLIFHTPVEIVNSQETLEKTDGFLTNTILQIVNVIAGLLKDNMDSLNIPPVLKRALKKLKSLFIAQTRLKDEGKTGKTEPENAKHSNETEEAGEASKDETKEQLSNKSKK